jgi:hypothetical protein
MRQHVGCAVKVVTQQAGQRGFAVLPKRGTVERSSAWFSSNRRWSQDHEYVAT